MPLIHILLDNNQYTMHDQSFCLPPGNSHLIRPLPLSYPRILQFVEMLFLFLLFEPVRVFYVGVFGRDGDAAFAVSVV
jgi:hypothetical protein